MFYKVNLIVCLFMDWIVVCVKKVIYFNFLIDFVEFRIELDMFFYWEKVIGFLFLDNGMVVYFWFIIMKV